MTLPLIDLLHQHYRMEYYCVNCYWYYIMITTLCASPLSIPWTGGKENFYILHLQFVEQVCFFSLQALYRGVLFTLFAKSIILQFG